MLATMRALPILLVLCSCFAEPPLTLTEEDASSGDGTGMPATTTLSTASAGSTSAASSSTAGATATDPSASGTTDAGSTSEESSSSEAVVGTSDSSESGSTGEGGLDPYRPCWPGEPMGGSQCDVGAHGSLCIADDDPRQTGYACTTECEQTADCPAPSSGSATPSCVDIGDFGVCVLDCELDGDCPDGMVCSVYATAAVDPWPSACVWPWGWWE